MLGAGAQARTVFEYVWVLKAAVSNTWQGNQRKPVTVVQVQLKIQPNCWGVTTVNITGTEIIQQNGSGCWLHPRSRGWRAGINSTASSSWCIISDIKCKMEGHWLPGAPNRLKLSNAFERHKCIQNINASKWKIAIGASCSNVFE